MYFLIYKTIWCSIHLIYNFIEILCNIFLFVLANLENFIILISKFKLGSNVDYELSHIKSISSNLQKIPLHLVLILSDDNCSPKNIDRVINYCQLAGVQFISLYDYKGKHYIK